MGVKKRLDLGRLIRAEVGKIEPYTPESLFPPELDPTSTKLDLNENYNVDPEVLREIMKEALSEIDLRLYPPPHGQMAVAALARFHRVGEEWIFVGNGIDGTLEKIARTFIDRGSKVGIVEPTFPMYAYYTQVAGGTKHPIDLAEGFRLDVDRVLAACAQGLDLLFVCSPNNPTGNQYPLDEMRRILDWFDGLLVLDEAYSEFGRYSMLDLLPEYENLAILKTFSKLFGMAAIRVGYMIAHPRVIDYVRRACPPFDVDGVGQAMVVAALAKWPYFASKIERIKEERGWLANRLRTDRGARSLPVRRQLPPRAHRGEGGRGCGGVVEEVEHTGQGAG